MILNATSEHRVVFVYLFWITTIYQTKILFETNKCHHGGPLERRTRRNCPHWPPLIRPCIHLWSLHDAIITWSMEPSHWKKRQCLFWIIGLLLERNRPFWGHFMHRGDGFVINQIWGGNFNFQRGDFCRLEYTKFWIDWKNKRKFVTSEPNHLMNFLHDMVHNEGHKAQDRTDGLII